MPIEIDFDPDVFHGELTSARAQVFVRAPRIGELTDCTLHGYVYGPHCEHAHTLPARFPLQDLGPGPTLLARAIVTDPCIWTNDLPHVYEVHFELRRGNHVLARGQRILGLRGIGRRVVGGLPMLVREGKGWVPRGVAVELLETQVVDPLREQLLVGVCAASPPDLLLKAGRRGLYLIVRLDARRQDVVRELRSVANSPAVMGAVIEEGDGLNPRLPQVAPNLVLFQAVNRGEVRSLTPAPWATGLWLNVTPGQPIEQADMRRLLELQLPACVQGAADRSHFAPDQVRQECDRLQSDLAPTGQFAGYFIACEEIDSMV
jgi:hypothetical protein